MHPCWIESFTTATHHLNSPAVFRRWTALSCISSAVQRRVWFRFNGTKVFLNLYVVLVGGPGVGKTISINAGRDTLSRISTVNFAANMGSKEKLLHSIAKFLKPIAEAKDNLNFQCACTAFIPELAVFIRPKDVEMINVLLDLYDCRNFRYETLSRDPAFLENPFFSILGGTTPNAFAENIARPYAGTGILSRINLIYSNESKVPDIFGAKATFDQTDFLSDLRSIHSLYGEMQFDGPAKRFVQEQVNAGIPPTPTDARLAEYLPRRAFHLMKLCCLVALARSNDLIVTRPDAERAMSYLLASEAELSPVLAVFGASPAIASIRSVETWLRAEHAASGKPILETDLRKKLLEEVPPQYITSTIAELVSSGTLKMATAGQTRVFIPIG